MNLTSRLQLAFLLVATSGASPLVAQQTTKSQNDPRPSAQAAPKTGSIVVDGKIDESAWSAATPIGELTQSSPNEGKPASGKTEIRILYDDAAIYVGARMFDSMGPKGVRSALARRDVIMNGGSSYDPVWEGATNFDSLCSTAELRIPYSQLRFSRDTAQSWGMQVWRNIERLNEADMWAFWRSNEFGGPAYFGTLNGIVVTSRPRQMEIVPYVTSRAKMERVAPNDPFHSKREADFRVGGDVKLNVTSNLTLDATVNPDFGQVEVDPAVVNPSVFETRFSEK